MSWSPLAKSDTMLAHQCTLHSFVNDFTRRQTQYASQSKTSNSRGDVDGLLSHSIARTGAARKQPHNNRRWRCDCGEQNQITPKRRQRVRQRLRHRTCSDFLAVAHRFIQRVAPLWLFGNDDAEPDQFIVPSRWEVAFTIGRPHGHHPTATPMHSRRARDGEGFGSCRGRRVDSFHWERYFRVCAAD